MQNKQEKLGSLAKENLVRFARETDKHLEEYWKKEINNNFGFNKTQKELVRKMLLHAREHNLRDAKRARASFVWYGYMLGQENGKPGSKKGEIWEVCEAVELVHTALLMHDDFMDNDLVRRGLPTTQVLFGKTDAHYGEAMAVNIGDAVLCLGYERLLNSGFEDTRMKIVMRQMLRGITNTAYGQAYDMSLPYLGKMTEDRVLSLHRAKTGIYTYENPLIIGGILSGLSDKVLDILRDYSKHSGIAFQLQDDVLGVYGDTEKTGKSADSDLLQGKVTLLVVKTLEMGSKKQKDDVLRVWGKKKAKKRDILLAKKAIKDSGAYEYSVKVARKLNEKAVEIIVKLREMNLNKEAIDYLEGIARYMVSRDV